MSPRKKAEHACCCSAGAVSSCSDAILLQELNDERSNFPLCALTLWCQESHVPVHKQSILLWIPYECIQTESSLLMRLGPDQDISTLPSTYSCKSFKTCTSPKHRCVWLQVQLCRALTPWATIIYSWGPAFEESETFTLVMTRRMLCAITCKRLSRQF